uniref:Uncharacterized protein n=1 Tax=Medicago truncatula TaxID=3880 RepID=Q2HT40_MEDTR|nr:hypothetical protein MtrDRAFT_AC150798g9v2 [Medicago truncatula]
MMLKRENPKLEEESVGLESKTAAAELKGLVVRKWSELKGLSENLWKRKREGGEKATMKRVGWRGCCFTICITLVTKALELTMQTLELCTRFTKFDIKGWINPRAIISWRLKL